MKFTDGFWQMKPGMQPYNAAHVVDYKVDEDGVTIYASHMKLIHRGMTLNAPLLTLRFTAPRANILSVRLSHHEGSAKREPRFELCREPVKLYVSDGEDAISITSGGLTAVVEKERFSVEYFFGGKRLTGMKDRHMGFVKTPEGNHMRAKFDVSVGEKFYGLGERFTPFVKNGQSVDMWNEDGGTASELAYKNIPFYLSNRGYGVFVNSSGRASYEILSEAASGVQLSLPGESVEFMVIAGESPKDVVALFATLTGKPALPPAWTFGLWLTTSFTTDYDEETVNGFVDEMARRGIPLHVFHFDCFWMKAYEWCNFSWDEEMFPDPVGMLKRLHEKGLKICAWINPYIAQKSPLFKEGMENGYLLKRPNGDVWQWDMWQAGMALVDFTNPAACAWYQDKLKALIDQGVDCFKTDFGERIPVDCVYHDGSDPVLMHNYYAHLYNKCVFELLLRERGEGEACVFARSATVGGQQFPVHWGGDSTSNYPSMAESLRAGLSLCLSGFAFWSHDMGGFEDMASPDVYKRWAAFGLLSTHSRLHGSSSYRVPWLFDEESVDVLRHFSKLKCRLMPYLFGAAVHAHQTGVPMMRAMLLEFPEDPAVMELDRQYMLGDSLLVAPVMASDNICEYYLPDGTWTHLLSGETVKGGHWQRTEYDFMSLPLFVRGHSLVAMGGVDDLPDYDYLKDLTICAYEIEEGRPLLAAVAKNDGTIGLTVEAHITDGRLSVKLAGSYLGLTIVLKNHTAYKHASGAAFSIQGGDTILKVEDGATVVEAFA